MGIVRASGTNINFLIEYTLKLTKLIERASNSGDYNQVSVLAKKLVVESTKLEKEAKKITSKLKG